MSEFFNVLPPAEALRLLLDQILPSSSRELIATTDALGRVTAGPILAPQDLPNFRRSTMDGYAVRAVDTYGASDALPTLLTVIGEVPMGENANVDIAQSQAATVHTGGMIPDTADAVVMIEHTQLLDLGGSPEEWYEIEVFSAASTGQNVIQVGEDVRTGDEILAGNSEIRAQDVGALLALGITEIAVLRKPLIGLISTGDEVVYPEQETMPGQIRDINSYTIGSLTREAGGTARYFGIVPDDFEKLLAEAEKALLDCDMVVISAGSSVSARDMTVNVVERLGKPGVLLHGVATRPGKPTILGAVGGRPIIGLPGNPVSAVVQFMMFGIPAIHRLLGRTRLPFRNRVQARLTKNIASESGREDYIPAKLSNSDEGWEATPIFGKSNLIFTLVKADGLIVVPLNEAGLRAGVDVEVLLF